MLSVAAHPSGTAFATGGSDAKVKLWDVGARACVQTVAEHTDQVTGELFKRTFGKGFVLFPSQTIVQGMTFPLLLFN